MRVYDALGEGSVTSEEDTISRSRSVPPYAAGQAVLVVALMSVTLSCCAAQDRPAGARLDVQVFVHDQNGTPATHLHANNFRLFQKQKQLMVQLLRANPGRGSSGLTPVPTRLLLLLDPSMEDSRNSTERMLAALEPVWSHGWEVAAGDGNGNVSAYATNGADLQRMWTPEGLRVAAISATTALRDLSSFDGRSIVIYVTGTPRQFSLPEQWFYERIRAAGAELLLVDGGTMGEEVSVLHTYIDSESNLSVPGPHPQIPWQEMPEEIALAQVARDPPVTIVHMTRSRGYLRGIFHELNTRAAVRDAIREASGFYDLRVTSRDGDPILSDATLLMELRGLWGLDVEERVAGEAEHPLLAVARR